MATIRTHGIGLTACISLLLLAVASPVDAQQGEQPQDRYILPSPEAAARGVEAFDVETALREQRSRFALFGTGDRAWTSLRLVGDNYQFVPNTTPGDDWGLFGGFTMRQTGTSSGTVQQHFGLGYFIGAPRSEWVKYLQEGVESLRNARGDPPGYTVMWNAGVFAGRQEINAADFLFGTQQGLIGSLLSGVQSTADGGCRDHSAGLGGSLIPAGFLMLPASNCPETWSFGGTAWLGDRPISPDNWARHFEMMGSDFRWNRWQVPADLKDQTAFLGTNVSTYGQFNDYNSTSLLPFGNVVPGGVGGPSRQGYPLGLDFVFDAYSFTLPAVANAVFHSSLIINSSETLYGVPHDYDSLYIGIGPWPARGQDGDSYSLPHLGAFVHSESDPPGDPKCAAVDPVPLIGQTCGGFGGSAPRWNAGGAGILVLKSPIGDLRNKLFNREGPFNLPGHPLAGDTITFNHSLNWNFGTQTFAWAQGTDRAKFGILSSTAQNTLDGSACADFSTPGDRWSTFMSNEWPDGNQCKKGHYVPGDWSYRSGRPFVDAATLAPLQGASLGPDTLFLHGCGPTGCPEVWSDSTWQGWSINRAGNLSQFSIGPFRLAAGDTTELLIAVYSGRDSASFDGATQAIVDFYLELFAGPEGPPPVTIRGVDVGAGITLGSDEEAEVTLVWDDAAESWVDPFLVKFAEDLETAAGGQAAVIRDANPGIVDRIRARASGNLSRLLLFRSCDGGATFDSDGDCRADEALDETGTPVGLGWEAFRIFEPDASGDFANTFTDGLVTPGVTYLYSIVGESRGFEEVVIVDEDARFETDAASETVGTGDGATTNFTGSLTNTPVSAGTVVLTDGVQTAQDDGTGGFTGDVDAGVANTIDYTTGAFDVTFAAAPATGADIDATYDFLARFTCGLQPCETDTFTVAPSLFTPLSRSAGDPNVLSVYVPVSVVAGGRGAQANFVVDTQVVFDRPVERRDLGANSTVPLDATLSSRDIREGTYEVLFGNFIEITEWRDASSEQLDSVMVRVDDLALTVVGDTGSTTANRVLASVSAKRTDGVPVTLSAATLTGETTVGNLLTRTYEIGPGDLHPNRRSAIGFLLVEDLGGQGLVPLLASGRLTGSAATPGAFLSSPAFPGFLISADNSNARTFDTEFDLDVNGDTIATQLDPTLNFDQARSVLRGVQDVTFGEYFVEYSDSVFGDLAPFRLDFENPEATDATFDASLAGRTAGSVGVTDAEAEALVGAAAGRDTATFQLVAARVPFVVRNLTHNRTAQLAVIDPGTSTRRKVLGVAPDSLSVTVDSTEWIPEDPLYVIEEDELFRTRDVAGDTAIVVDESGVPVRETRRFLSFAPMILTCGGANSSCNPVRGPGFAGALWIGARPGDELHLRYFSPFEPNSRFTLQPQRAMAADAVMAGNMDISAQMDSIRVVPNPYVFFSQYERAGGERRLMFTHLPPDGELRIYTLAGNFVQEIDWQPSDLTGNGDLFWDMQTREGNELGAGLFIFVITAVNPATGAEIKKMGKFVVIR